MTKRFKTRLIIISLGALFNLSVLASEPEGALFWIKKSQSIKGSWSIEVKEDGEYLILSDDFKTRKGPDLKLLLSTLSSAEVNGKNASEGSLFISELESNKGGQSYKLPKGYTDYSTLLIHCEKYSKLWGASDLEPSSDY